MAVPSSRLAKTLEKARENEADIVILDTAPHSEGTALEAARSGRLDPGAVSAVDYGPARNAKDRRPIQLLQEADYAVLNEVSPQGSVADEAGGRSRPNSGMMFARFDIGQRVAFNRCLLAGQTAQEYEPGGKAAGRWIDASDGRVRATAVGVRVSVTVRKRESRLEGRRTRPLARKEVAT